jgi:hypothetical protein
LNKIPKVGIPIKFSLWVDRATNKKSIGTSPFKLVYGTEAIFPVQLALLVANFLQENDSKPSDLTRRIHNLVELQQVREKLLEKTELHQEKMKEIFNKKVKTNIFKIGELVLKWDVARQEKGKHGKFYALWAGPFVINNSAEQYLCSPKSCRRRSSRWPFQWAFSKDLFFIRIFLKPCFTCTYSFQFCFFSYCLNNSMPNGTKKNHFSNFQIVIKATESN